MSREKKINKMIEEIKMRRNDEQYSGGPFPIYHIEFDILNEEIERLNNIIKEAIEYIESDYIVEEVGINKSYITIDKEKLLEILKKEENNEIKSS